MENRIIYDYEFGKWVHQCWQRYKDKKIKRIVVLRDEESGETIFSITKNSDKRIRQIISKNKKVYTQQFSGDVKEPMRVRRLLYDYFRSNKCGAGKAHTYILSGTQFEDVIKELNSICVYPLTLTITPSENGGAKLHESIGVGKSFID